MAAPDELPVGRIAAVGGLLFGILAAVLLLTWAALGLFDRWDAPKAVPVLATRPLEVPEPRLQTDAAGDLARRRAAEDAELHRLAWVDRKAGVARIPIEDAMALLARDGWP